MVRGVCPGLWPWDKAGKQLNSINTEEKSRKCLNEFLSIFIFYANIGLTIKEFLLVIRIEKVDKIDFNPHFCWKSVPAPNGPKSLRPLFSQNFLNLGNKRNTPIFVEGSQLFFKSKKNIDTLRYWKYQYY